MRGRQPSGPEFVDRLQGEEGTKQRLRVILQTLSGQLGFQEAATLLGITPQRLHVLRQQALQAAVTALAPQPAGRPRQAAAADPAQLALLEQENERLRHELEASRLREEIALLLPGRRPGEKKRGSGAAETDRAGQRGRRRGGRGGVSAGQRRGQSRGVRGDCDQRSEGNDRPRGGPG
jgi:hypothetical protein